MILLFASAHLRQYLIHKRQQLLERAEAHSLVRGDMFRPPLAAPSLNMRSSGFTFVILACIFVFITRSPGLVTYHQSGQLPNPAGDNVRLSSGDNRERRWACLGWLNPGYASLLCRSAGRFHRSRSGQCAPAAQPSRAGRGGDQLDGGWSDVEHRAREHPLRLNARAKTKPPASAWLKPLNYSDLPGLQKGFYCNPIFLQRFSSACDRPKLWDKMVSHFRFTRRRLRSLRMATRSGSRASA